MLTKKDKQGIWLISLVLAVVLALLGGRSILTNKPKPNAENCFGTVTANTVIVLDHTEQINDQTQDEILARAMKHVREDVKVNERVSVFTISDLSKKSLKPIFSQCRPPEDGNRLIEDVRSIRKRFQDAFEKPLRAALSMPPKDSRESPIAQAITDLSLSQYLRGTSNSLLVFSDMLENTAGFSLYKCTNASETISRYRESRRGAMERPEFKNTSIALHLIPRLGQSSESMKCRTQLWTWFFGNSEGSKAALSFDYLPGGVSMAPSGGSK